MLGPSRHAGRGFATGRSWQPGSSLARELSRKPAVKSLVGATVHGAAPTHVANPASMPLFRRGGVDKKFESGAEAAALVHREVRRRDGAHAGLVRSVDSVASSLIPVFDAYPRMAWAFKHLVEPERVIQFKVPWTDKDGNTRINRGCRVQHSSVLGPFAGGLSFAQDMTTSRILEDAFEQVFQNSLTGLRLGGARGGADFHPQGKTRNEIKSFCQSYIMELARYIGPAKDVPCGGFGVGEREIGYMYGRYKRMTRRYDGGIAGDAVVNDLAGDVSLNRERASGTGVVLFAKQMIETASGGNNSLEGARCIVSGSGNVALAVARALVDAGAVPITLSDTTGYVCEPGGFTSDMLDQVERVKKSNPYQYNRRMSEYCKFSATSQFFPHAKGGGADSDSTSTTSFWEIPGDYAFPCAGHSEIGANEAKAIVQGEVKGVFEAATMPCTQDAVRVLRSSINFLYAPAKAANAGGPIMTSLGMSHATSTNTRRLADTTQEDLFGGLFDGMSRVFDECQHACDLYNVDMHDGANIAAFSRLGHAMIRQGYV
jgi:glutamate dehydrogenase (NADP+)